MYTSLTLLALDSNQITDEGCAALASALRSGALPSLVTLAVDKGSTTPYRGRQPSVARMRSRECSRRGLGSRGFDTSGALPSKIAILNSEHTLNGLLNEGGITLTEKPELFLLPVGTSYILQLHAACAWHDYCMGSAGLCWRPLGHVVLVLVSKK